jgi:SNF2 family DNA or RNA helicase
MDAVEDYLREEEIGYVRIDGTFTTAARNALVSKFQEDDKVTTNPSESYEKYF